MIIIYVSPWPEERQKEGWFQTNVTALVHVPIDVVVEE